MRDEVMVCGYRIVFDLRQVPDTMIWMGKAAVVKPADEFGIERVEHIVAKSCFTSERAAFDNLISDAKNLINTQVDNQLTKKIGC